MSQKILCGHLSSKLKTVVINLTGQRKLYTGKRLASEDDGIVSQSWREEFGVLE